MFWDPDPDFFPHPGSGSWGQKSTGSRIRNRNTASIRGKSYKMPRVHFTGSPLGRPRRSTWRWVSPPQWRPPACSGTSSSQSPRLSHPKHMHIIIVLSAKFWSQYTATQCWGSGFVLSLSIVFQTLKLENEQPESGLHRYVLSSVADPDLEDPYVFGPRIRILLSSSKNSMKNLDSYCFVTFLWFFTVYNFKK